MPEDNEAYLHERAGAAIDAILDLLEQAGRQGVDIDPLSLIIERLQARGETLDLDEAPPMLRMLLGGMTA
jgi:hypothetical protein